MNKITRVTLGTVFLSLAAGALLLASLKLPLWRMRMESPQYRDQEALRVAVYPHAMRGDLGEIKVLNQYIGVSIPDRLPQTRWLPTVLIGGALLGLAAVALPMAFRRRALLTVAVLIALAMLASAGTAQWQMYRIGHDRNHHAALRGVKDFTPPLLGTEKIENFTVSAWLGAGSYLIVAAIALEIGGAFVACGKRCPHCHPSVCPDIVGSHTPQAVA